MPSLAPRIPLTCLSIRVRSLQLDLDVDASRQVEPHERVDRLRSRVDDVDQTLVRAHLEVLARVLVLVRRTDHAETVDLRGQRHRASNLRPGTRHRLHDLPRRGVDDLVVVGLEPDADLLSRHGGFCFLLSMPLLVREPLAPTCPQALPAIHLVDPALSDPRGRACRACCRYAALSNNSITGIWSAGRVQNTPGHPARVA